MICFACKKEKENCRDFSIFYDFILPISPDIRKEEMLICDDCYNNLKTAIEEFKIQQIANKLGGIIKGKIDTGGGIFGAWKTAKDLIRFKRDK